MFTRDSLVLPSAPLLNFLKLWAQKNKTLNQRSGRWVLHLTKTEPKGSVLWFYRIEIVLWLIVDG